MRYIKLTDGKKAKVDDRDFYRMSRWAWRAAVNPSGHWYATRQVWESGKNRTVFMHRELMGDPEGFMVDHRNRDSLDNQKENLRLAEEDAARAYDAAASEYFGEFALLNFPAKARDLTFA